MQTFEFEVQAETAAAADRLTADLARSLKFSAPEVMIARLKTDGATMDAGSILSITLGSATATALSHGIAMWIAKRNSASLTIKKDGTVVAKNIGPSDLLKLAEIFQARRENGGA